jgi:mannose-1-phosphate guanylyltransferase
MKKLFPEFELTDDKTTRDAWNNAIFVFDTNVLLNAHRYQKETLDQLMAVLEKVKHRIWIPYHVALEYQRARLSVIVDQRNKFREVSDIVLNRVANLKADLANLALVT